jgi:uncharacterized repeat protein (TIGR03803 family)
MPKHRKAVLTAVCVAALAANAAYAGTETVLHTFHGFPQADGANPVAAPILDSKGDLFGTSEAGGSAGCGVVYKLHKSQTGTWGETILYSFTCGDDGDGPDGGVIMDSTGVLYGDTALGGTGHCLFGCGVVYKLSPGKGGAWTETVLYSFPAPSGDYFGPEASLTFGAKGTLYGTTVLDAQCAGPNYGSVFRLKLVNRTWKEHDIRDFCNAGHDGRSPGYGALVFDAAGNMYGTTSEGGNGDDQGEVFELSPLGHDKWKFAKLHQFTQEEGGVLQGGLTFDESGDLFGAEYYGPYETGAIFELSPKVGGGWKNHVLYEFIGGQGPDGVNAWQNPVFDANGNLFGTTQGGGETQYCVNCGVIYELVPKGGGAWSESVVYSFGSQLNVADGSDPLSTLTRDGNGNFYGTTYQGGDPSCGNCGVVFEFTP